MVCFGFLKNSRMTRAAELATLSRVRRRGLLISKEKHDWGWPTAANGFRCLHFRF